MNARAAASYDFTRSHNDYVQKPDMRIVDVLQGLAGINGKGWVKVRYTKILELLWKFHRRRMSARSLARHLGAFEDQGYIVRRRLHETGYRGELVLRPTLYTFARRAWQRLRNLTRIVHHLSTNTAKLLSGIAVPELAETLTASGYIYDRQRRKAPPKR
jgi:hypothetical protein